MEYTATSYPYQDITEHARVEHIGVINYRQQPH